jgi:acetyltransferase-like isoleucine patch superfamily enzyme
MWQNFKNKILYFLFRIRGKTIFIGKGCNFISVSIGSYTYFAGDAIVKYTTIGKYCSIARGVRIGLGKHPTKDVVSTHPVFHTKSHHASLGYNKEDFIERYPLTTIGNDVWLGQSVLIMSGVTIGDGAIVGAGAVVTQDVEPYSIVVGVPAKHIRYRLEPDEIKFLLNFKWWNKPEAWVKDHLDSFLDIKKFIRENS